MYTASFQVMSDGDRHPAQIPSRYRSTETILGPRRDGDRVRGLSQEVLRKVKVEIGEPSLRERSWSLVRSPDRAEVAVSRDMKEGERLSPEGFRLTNRPVMKILKSREGAETFALEPLDETSEGAPRHQRRARLPYDRFFVTFVRHLFETGEA
jgi:hypothetical protein